jgi:hypothetical protein
VIFCRREIFSANLIVDELASNKQTKNAHIFGSDSGCELLARDN